MNKLLLTLTIAAGSFLAAPEARAQWIFLDAGASSGCTGAQSYAPYQAFNWICTVAGQPVLLPNYIFQPAVYDTVYARGICASAALTWGEYSWDANSEEADVYLAVNGLHEEWQVCFPNRYCYGNGQQPVAC